MGAAIPAGRRCYRVTYQSHFAKGSWLSRTLDAARCADHPAMRARLATNPTMARRFDRKCRAVTAHGLYALAADSASSTDSATSTSTWPCIVQSFYDTQASGVPF